MMASCDIYSQEKDSDRYTGRYSNFKPMVKNLVFDAISKGLQLLLTLIKIKPIFFSMSVLL